MLPKQFRKHKFQQKIKNWGKTQKNKINELNHVYYNISKKFKISD
jgi:hypothetical protein